MTFSALWAFLALALPVLAALIASLSSVDLAYHLRAGEVFLDTRAIPTTDTFSFTVDGQPWLNQQWGAQVVLAATYRVAGWTGLVVLRAALVGALCWLIYAAARRQGLQVRRAAWLTLAAFAVSSVALALRPQLFGMVLFALVLLIVVERRRRRWVLWLAPPVIALWANLHGSFFLGPVVLIVAWLADAADGLPSARHTLVAAVVAVAATFLNPFGPAVWVYAVGLTASPLVTDRITEWQPTTIRTVPGAAFFVSALLVGAVLARRDRPAPWPALLWFGVFFCVGAWAIRGLAWWAPAAAVGAAGVLGTGFFGAGAAESPDPAPREARRRLNIALAGALAVASGVLVPWWRPIDPGLLAPVGVVGHAPPGITQALRDVARPGDRLYMPQPWGSWFELAVPDAKVVLDSRFELYPEPVWSAYEQVASGRAGWEQRLDEWRVTLVVATDEQEGGLLAQLRRHPGWRVVHDDEDGAVFVRAGRPR